tara:strand:- start:332 stop:583 length:252 start_codon:yes stop_codon:yes gene_type:complete
MNKKEIIKQGINLFNKHFPNDKHTTENEKSNLVKFFIDLHELKESKKIKVLQSKVKTYEQDINKKLEEIETQNFENDLNSINN